jgi:hypothetical protein
MKPEKTCCLSVAQGKIEELRSQSFDSLSGGSFSVSSPSGATGYIEISHDINADGENEEDIVQAKVTVDYEVKKESREVQISTYISREGIAK